MGRPGDRNSKRATGGLDEQTANSHAGRKHARTRSAREKFLKKAGLAGSRPSHYSDGMLDMDDDEESSSSTSSSVSLKDMFADRHNKSLPSSLGLNKKQRHRWRDLPIEKQLELLKNSARREALVAQARLWEAQEKQRLLSRLERNENLDFVKQTLANMAQDSEDPFLELTSKLIDDEESEANYKIGAPSTRGGRTGRTSSISAPNSRTPVDQPVE